MTRTESARAAPPIEPCDPTELRILRGLLASAAACRWFEDMGVGLAVFTDRRCRVLATWAVQHDCKGKPPLVTEALDQANGNERSMAEWLEFTFGQAAPPDPKSRDALVTTIERRAEEEANAGDSDKARAARRLDAARRGLALYDRLETAANTPKSTKEHAAEAEAAFCDMREACRELSPRWFPGALREAAAYYERTGVKGTDPADGLAYLDMLLTFIRGEIN